MIIIASGLFAVTMLAYVASSFGDKSSPAARWLARHGGTLVLYEVAAIIAASLIALTIDRLQTLRDRTKKLPDTTNPPEPSKHEQPSPTHS